MTSNSGRGQLTIGRRPNGDDLAKYPLSHLYPLVSDKWIFKKTLRRRYFLPRYPLILLKSESE
jgi:hypothetical protein